MLCFQEFEESIHDGITKEEVLESIQNVKEKINEAERLEKEKCNVNVNAIWLTFGPREWQFKNVGGKHNKYLDNCK